MKSLLSSTALLTAGLVSLALVSSANATTFTVSESLVLPADTGVPAPASSVDYLAGVTTNTPTISLNPFGNTTSPYSVLNQGTATVPLASAIFNAAAGGSNIFKILWGSPDPYNSIEFFTGLNGTGAQIGSTLTGCSLTLNTCTGGGFDNVTFSFLGGTYGSVELLDTNQAAFEFSNVTTSPIPAALPLVAAGLGVLGFVSRRRKHRSVSAFAAA